MVRQIHYCPVCKSVFVYSDDWIKIIEDNLPKDTIPENVSKSFELNKEIRDESYKQWYRDWIAKVQEWLDYYRNNLSVKVSKIEELLDEYKDCLIPQFLYQFMKKLESLLPKNTEWQ